MNSVRDLLPGAEYHLLGQAGHYAPYEQPEAAGRIFGQFFDGVSRSSNQMFR